MGFNKRYFSKESIINHAKGSTYESFKVYMLNPDACIFESDGSSDIWESFAKAKEEERKKIYSKLKS